MLEVANKTRAPVPRREATSIFRRAFRRVRMDVSLAFVGDATMRRLNRIYRGDDKTTDVLSFLLEPGMGQIVISVPRAVADAKKEKVPVRAKILMLVAHGMAHVRGYDHARLRERRIMKRLEASWLRGLV